MKIRTRISMNNEIKIAKNDIENGKKNFDLNSADRPAQNGKIKLY